MSDATIEAIRSGRAPMGLPPKEGVFAQAARELVRDGTLGDRTYQAIEHLLGRQGTVELIVTIGYYTMLSRIMTPLGVELEGRREPAGGGNATMSTTRRKAGVGCAAALGSMVGLFVVSLLVFRFVWGWVMPDVLPGAVEQGLVAESLGWSTSAKLALPIAILGGMFGFHRGSDT